MFENHGLNESFWRTNDNFFLLTESKKLRKIGKLFYLIMFLSENSNHNIILFLDIIHRPVFV
jgi:hypothetical protein